MAHFIRVLAGKNVTASATALSALLAEEGSSATVSVLQGGDSDWTQLSLKEGPSEVALIEKNPVVPDSLGKSEIQEFLAEVKTALPHSAAEWLAKFLGTVTTIYSFQLLGTDSMQGVYILFGHLRELGEGIFQSDGEGFSNLKGSHILWQFSDDVTGPWEMAVLHEGRWVKFQMDLGNRKHRAAFLSGAVPKGVTASWI